MNHWNAIRTAYFLAQHGTISGAAKTLDVHRATILRHIDYLEAELGVKLFQRSARGYLPTEAGEELMRVAGATEDQFEQLRSRLKQRQETLTGEFVITSLPALAPILLPAIDTYQALYPAIQVRYLTSEKLFRLEYGEAHVAVRSGEKPDHPDNVVLPFTTQVVGLYAHRNYVTTHGRIDDLQDIPRHRFVCTDELKSRVPGHDWILKHVPKSQIVFTSNDPWVLQQALYNATGIGFLFQHQGQANPELVEMLPPQPEWRVRHWLVSHGDLHRSEKVQAFLRVLLPERD